MARLRKDSNWAINRTDVQMGLLDALKRLSKLKYTAYQTSTNIKGMRTVYYRKPNTLTEYRIIASLDEWNLLNGSK